MSSIQQYVYFLWCLWKQFILLRKLQKTKHQQLICDNICLLLSCWYFRYCIHVCLSVCPSTCLSILAPNSHLLRIDWWPQKYYVFESGCGPSNRECMSPLEWLMLLHVNRHFMLVGGRTVVVFSIVFLKAPLRNYFLTESSTDKHHSDDTFCFDLEYICTNIEKVRDQITTLYKWQVIIRSFFCEHLFIYSVLFSVRL